MIKSEDVKKLAELSRIEVSEADIDKMTAEIGGILGYIDRITAVAGDSDESRVESAGTRNVMRSDEFSENPADTKALLDEAPVTMDGYIKVKKIL